MANTSTRTSTSTNLDASANTGLTNTQITGGKAMAFTVTTNLAKLRVLFNSVKEIYYKNTEIKSADLGTAVAATLELPVLEDSVTFNTGDPDIQRIKVTSGSNWVTKAKKGEPDITFQIASLAGDINDMFMDGKSAVTSGAGALVEGATYKGNAYSLAPKKVTGSLIMFSEDRQVIIILPNVEMYGSLVAAEGDNPAYFNVGVTPILNSEGKDIMILEKQA